MKLYAVKNKNESVRMCSRSGGVFSALSDLILDDGGLVYGCVLDEQMKAKHVRADSTSIRDRMRNSKYVESEIGYSYKQVVEDLSNDREVLFTGTPCQVEGIKKIVDHKKRNLLLVDIACHGVVSPQIWKDYLQWQEKKQKGRSVVSANFRNKNDFGWRDHVETLVFDNGKRLDSRVYTNIFYSLLALRPSCFNCLFMNMKRPGDITLADFWGIDSIVKGFDDNKGVSLVLVNNEKGQRYFDAVLEYLEVIEVEINPHMMQRVFTAPYEKPEKYEKFWDDYRTKSFERMARLYGEYGMINKIKAHIGRFIYG